MAESRTTTAVVSDEEKDEDSGITAAPPKAIVFDELVTTNLGFVWRALRRLGVPPADVDDATQQVFLVATRKLPSILPGRERAFLLGVATRVASHTRRAADRRESASARLSEVPTESVPDPEHVTQRRQARELLDEVLDSMPTDVRAVFVLFELEDMSVDEIADSLSIPRGTAASRLRRARTLFRREAARLRDSTSKGAS